MAYLGRGLDKISNIEVLDNITFDGSSSYSITKGSVAFVVNSAQSCLLSIDGVVQATNFTVNGSTINFGVAIPSTSTCNFFLHYGTGVMTVPSDGSVTTAKLGNSAVDLTSKVTGALPVANGGTNLTSGFANGITMADSWRISANFTSSNGTNDFTSNWERSDQSAIGLIGTGMTESSGIFTFPSTGIYFVTAQIYIMLSSSASQYVGAILNTTTNNSSYDQVAMGYTHVENVTSQHNNVAITTLFDVTNTSTHKIKFAYESQANFLCGGSSTNDRTFIRFIRLGDT